MKPLIIISTFITFFTYSCSENKLDNEKEEFTFPVVKDTFGLENFDIHETTISEHDIIYIGEEKDTLHAYPFFSSSFLVSKAFTYEPDSNFLKNIPRYQYPFEDYLKLENENRKKH